MEYIDWLLYYPYGWNWNLPCNYLHFQLYIKVPTRYFIDTAGELHLA